MSRKKKAPPALRFSAEEDAVILAHYKDGAQACQALLPTARSLGAIRKRARRLEVSHPQPGINEDGLALIQAWVDGERQRFPSLKSLADHLGVSSTAVLYRAEAMGYQKRARRKPK